MKKLICLFFFLQLGTIVGQPKKWVATKTDTLQVEADTYLGFDSFGAYYFLKNNVFIKKTKSKTWQYKNLSLGKIAKVAIQNPLNIVLFYENFNTVVLLDNQLNEIQKINFSEASVPIVVAATGIAFGNRLWIYNSLLQQIGLFDYLKSDFKTITPPFPGVLKYYESDFNSFRWIDENQNWYQTTIYGNVSLQGKVPDSDQTQMISESELIFKKKEALYYYSTSNAKSNLIDIDEKTFKNFYYKDQILSIFTSQGITNYKITTP